MVALPQRIYACSYGSSSTVAAPWQCFSGNSSQQEAMAPYGISPIGMRQSLPRLFFSSAAVSAYAVRQALRRRVESAAAGNAETV